MRLGCVTTCPYEVSVPVVGALDFLNGTRGAQQQVRSRCFDILTYGKS